MSDPAHLAQIIDKYRASCNFYVKLDFAGMGLVATVATLFRFNEEKVAFFGFEIMVWIAICGFLAAGGMVFDHLMLECWSEAVLGRCGEKIVRSCRRVGRLQSWIHVGLIGYLVGDFTALIHDISRHVK